MNFPDPQTHDFPEWVLVGEYFYYAKDVVVFGTPLTVESVAEAYRKGIFPWYTKGIPLPWHCPERRAILEFDELHIPRSLKRAQQKVPYTFTIDKDFHSVIKNCAAAKRPDQGGTWITKEFVDVYCELFDAGMAHSVEAWDADGKLVGGLYGIDAGGVFCGESMFHKAPNASKLALLFLIDHMQARGAAWLDAQVMTPHLEALGAREIDRMEFLSRLSQVQSQAIKLFD
jgi:leucyl/phenylalanyl-tRNA--protein transferase